MPEDGNAHQHHCLQPLTNAVRWYFISLFPVYYRDQTWFSCINVRQVPREVLKTEAGGRGFQHLPRDLANVNALKTHIRSLLLHKN